MQDQQSCARKFSRHRCLTTGITTYNYQQEKNMIPIPLLIFHFACAIGWLSATGGQRAPPKTTFAPPRLLKLLEKQ